MATKITIQTGQQVTCGATRPTGIEVRANLFVHVRIAPELFRTFNPVVKVKKRRNPTADTGVTVLGKLVTLLREAVCITLFSVAAYLFVCLLTYSPGDPGFTHTGSNAEVMNSGGKVGAWLADLMFALFGRMSYFLLFLLSVVVWRFFRGRSATQPARWVHVLTPLGFILAITGTSGLEHIYFPYQDPDIPLTAGGITGMYGARFFADSFGVVGGTVILLTLLITGVTFVVRFSWFDLMDRVGYQAFVLAGYLKAVFEHQTDRRKGAKLRKQRQATVKEIREVVREKKPPKIEPKINAPVESGRKQKERQTTLFKDQPVSGVFPDLSLMDEPQPDAHGYSKEMLESMSQLLVKKLRDFNVEVTVVAVQPGPVITRFEIEPSPGVKASQIVGLSRDLARSLSVVSVRVVENIPGKTVIGIEIPNQKREVVRLVEGLSSLEYEKSKSPLTLVLGKDIAGNAVIADLIKMPHVLIAGTTGAGKSVCINALILSLVYKATPEQVRMIMVDPKFLELSNYDGIPHLLTPVVTDMNEAANALRWCIGEMDRRFRLLASAGVRNIAGFNKKVDIADQAGQPLFDTSIQNEDGVEPEPLGKLPYIVVIVDELADLMMVVGKKIEEIIIRIAQRARAAGIHLVLATQRPSVDVVTGLIKANVPTRIAFQVSSRADSRTVLDQMGAEQLLGQGDMLYLPPGSGFTQRVHGSFVSDEEVAKVVVQLKGMGEPVYLDEVTTGEGEVLSEGGERSEEDGESDPLYDEAVQFVIQSRKASISAVQRALRVGYNRAARMIETMEAAGIVSTSENGKRAVLVPASE